jgi:hypothetical protein
MSKHNQNESIAKKTEYTTVKIEKQTLSDLKEWQKTINAKSLPETIRLTLGYAKSFNGDFLVAQSELADRVAKLESSQNGIFVYLSNVLGDILALRKQIQKLEEMKNE